MDGQVQLAQPLGENKLGQQGSHQASVAIKTTGTTWLSEGMCFEES